MAEQTTFGEGPTLKAAVDVMHSEWAFVAGPYINAYLQCSSPYELARALLIYCRAQGTVYSEIRKALLSKVRQDGEVSHLDDLQYSLRRVWEDAGKCRQRIDGFLSTIYEYLTLPARVGLLEWWQDRKTASAENRWVKAYCNDESIFDLETAMDYWKKTRHPNLLKEIVASSTEISDDFLVEIMEQNAPGWLVARAGMKSLVGRDARSHLLEEYPATALYLAAKKKISLDPAEALSAARRVPSEIDEPDHDSERGLAVWALGRLSMKHEISLLYSEHVASIREKFSHS